MERREAAAEVYSALDRLAEKYRSVVILFEIEGLSGEEIASLTGINLATVWVHLHRGRQKLRAHYRELLKKRGER
jgi:RNA polymerase sigma-70 factor (ECF subfamily)